MIATEAPPSVQTNVGGNGFPNCGAPLEPAALVEAPIHSLPPEVLLSIFEILFKMEEDDNIWEFDREDYPSILRLAVMPDSITNVCTYWDFVASLEPKFWQRLLIFMDPMQPNPVSRLQRRLERNKVARRLRFKLWTPMLDWSSFRWSAPPSAESDNDTKALERDRIGRMIPLIQQHAHRACSLGIATMFEDSLPPPKTIFPIHPDGTRSIQHIYLVSHPDTAKAHTPMNVTTTPLVYPDPSIHTALEPSHFLTANYLVLHGSAFVSFCREYLTLQAGEYNAIGGESALSMVIAIGHVTPLDGGTETPFTFHEFLQIVRLFCGRVGELRVNDVVLPLHVPRKGRKKRKFFAKYPWITCKGQDSAHSERLKKVTVERSNSELVLGIVRVFEDHLFSSERGWTMRTGVDGEYLHFSVAALRGEVEAQKPGTLLGCKLRKD